MDWAAEWPSTVHPHSAARGTNLDEVGVKPSALCATAPAAQAGGHDWGLATARDDDQQGE